ncbi:putative methyltransferase BMT2 [Cryptotermes secundus]|uniref:S-adenosylmethionine sensor upstream of mTORC1 n=1 Tax=Cryptotermes secundus TaxID=105785 RepID=A0A2J7QPW0_9NEOP|nr:S-adenosylmethionine sensor upstream of mTORC1 [Cryptotermes secundus]XP_023710418.1 S-adenosylmethionine sensor upstream of mTORC1 [Cryptotermes secundus]PNF30614.1 putative methyltransferase BMT2 [Cryptotermes secundus]PNF30615.1 putative methyltransferase BMT2 [Cryptotermes secundus]
MSLSPATYKNHPAYGRCSCGNGYCKQVRMAAEEHQQLSAFVKSIHQMLRSEAQKIGADKAWKEHCMKTDILQKYAVSMQKLASTFWEQNSADEKKSAQCRIKWIVEKCVLYFFKGEMEMRRIKEKKKIKKTGNAVEKCGETCALCVRVISSKEVQGDGECLTLLDVGSCYNPFRVYPFLNVIPIDIAPAKPDVYVCDFLNMAVVETEEPVILNGRSVVELPAATCDVVVFSLLLEYFPSPKQRYLCVCKAYNLLKPEGLLFIITPDSKHSSANAPLMKSWRITLAQLGFSLGYYEKLPHIHCMAYRKDIHPEVAKHWAYYELRKQNGVETSSKLYIPQDFQEMQDKSDNIPHPEGERTIQDNASLVQMFSQLPYNSE